MVFNQDNLNWSECWLINGWTHKARLSAGVTRQSSEW
jgi:hypothetical protein